MELLELSKKRLKEENNKLFNLIIKEYNFDLVIFIARGSYLIGKELADMNNVPLLEIFATRKGGKFKKIISPILKIIPKRIKNILRDKEFNSNYHEKNNDRKIYFDEKIWKKYNDKKNILLVDDSVDTGYSILYAKNEIEKYFSNSTVKVGAINCFKKSKNIVNTDFYLYSDVLLLGPWSNDSKENYEYIKEYEDWHEKQK